MDASQSDGRNRRVRLLIYAHYFVPSVGGVETVVLALAAGLTTHETGYEVIVVTQTRRGEHDDDSLPYQVVRCPSWLRLWRLIQKVDVVHAAGTAIGPVVLGLLARKPVVVEHHGFQAICPNGQLLQQPQDMPCPGHFMAGNHAACLRCSPRRAGWTTFRLWLFTFVRRWLCRQVAVNLVPTGWLGGLLRLPRTEIVHHGVITPQALPEPAAHEAACVLFIGRLVKPKGVHILLQAVQSLHERGMRFQTCIVGDGPERALLEERMRSDESGAVVRFLGKLAEADLPEVLRQACVLVVPSLGGEVFGMVVLENMARGIPVIASDIGAFQEVMGDAGVSFQTGDADDLARHLAAVLNDRDLSARLAESSARRASEFTLRRMVDEHACIYCRLADGRPQEMSHA
ncbi:glycosyltransferase family 4 protein [Prosthecobacter sp.]|uniref:glycosyltransferase family 4 protein n=1 Tax=Prosthecobacter sp. TaxID=1965333 RepID=UPI002ABA7D8E|nr:glycosyltransferase family 4 protein [Prosthecobacter sp.]MDZ4404121.1 glycosyltransferase family 4 protein [Prosthecobacter sp.]